MTNKDYITASLNGLNVSEIDIDIILLKSGIAGGLNANPKECDKAVYDRFSVVLKGMAQNISEGGYSISWNIDLVKSYYSSLCFELGLPNVLEPKIRDKSNIW